MEKVRFERMARLVRDPVHPSAAPGAKLVGLEHIGKGTLHLTGFGYAEQASTTKYRFRTGDILFGKLRPGFRKIARAPFDGICSTDIWVVRPREGVDPRFLFYLMASDRFLEPVVRASDGTGMPRATWRYAAALRLPLPSMPEQRAIAARLGSLDAKIALNRRMNATLEEMARTMFRSWFVDFDPVRARARSRLPAGLDAATVALFPDAFHTTVRGPIPRGWKLGSLDEVAAVHREHVHPASLPQGTRYLGLEHLPKRSATLERWSSTDGLRSPKARFEHGDVLFGKLRPYLHKVVPAPFGGVCSTDILVVRPAAVHRRWFVFGHLHADAMVAHAAAAASGTRMPRAKWSDLCRFPIALPPDTITRAFHRLADPLYRRIWHNVEESRTLAALRDTLLPELLAGKRDHGAQPGPEGLE